MCRRVSNHTIPLFHLRDSSLILIVPVSVKVIILLVNSKVGTPNLAHPKRLVVLQKEGLPLFAFLDKCLSLGCLLLCLLDLFITRLAFFREGLFVFGLAEFADHQTALNCHHSVSVEPLTLR